MTKILCIDGNQSGRLILDQLLTSRGFAVMTAKDGLEGIRKAREARPDLIFIDLGLPWLDYSEVIKQLKGIPRTWHIPIILASILPADRGAWLAHEAGAQDFIAKPYRVEELIDIIRKHLKSGSQDAGDQTSHPPNTGHQAATGLAARKGSCSSSLSCRN